VLGVKGALLGGFANKGNNKLWGSVLGNVARLSPEEIIRYQFHDNNFRRVYELDSAYFAQNVDAASEMIVDLGFELQRCFNMGEYRNYHYIPDTNTFPWKQYYDELWY